MADASPHDSAEIAVRLGVSREAAELTLGSDVIDLHIDSFIWSRVGGYDLGKRHTGWLVGPRFLGHADLPRLEDAGFKGATWVISTNPLRTAKGRSRTFVGNVRRLESTLRALPNTQVVRTEADYRSARASGRFACFVGVQGGNALGNTPAVLDELEPHSILRVTLIHLTSSTLGATSSPAKLLGADGLTGFGADVVRALDARRVFVDLAHASRKTFFDAVAAHDRSLPLIVTHTGISGVYPHWRNLDDDQLRAIADTGGVVGLMYHVGFLGPRGGAVTTETLVDHLEHIVDTVGEDHAALGSDWDGAITAPRDMPTCTEFPRLVDAMLRRGWSSTRIQKILGQNFLRSLRHLRG